MNMDEITHIFIVNPAAGKTNRSEEAARDIKAAAAKHGVNYEIHVTEYQRQACYIVQQASQRYAGKRLRFYACGGDGTLNEVANTAIRVPDSAFTHYPLGSGNDFIKIFGAEAMRRFFSLEELIMGDETMLDYIESDCGIALNILSAGLDARVAKEMQKYKRLPMLQGHASYTASVIENVIRGMHDPYHVEIDGIDYDGQYTMILVANGRCYGGGYYAVPDADPTDGILDILLVKALGRLTAAKIINQYKDGKYREMPEYIRHVQGRSMTLLSRGARPMTINLDGEIENTTRLSLRVADTKMRVAVPRGVRVAEPDVDFSAYMK